MIPDDARPIKVTHAIAGLAAEHGGPSYSVPRLVEALCRLDIDAELLAVARGSPTPDLPAGTKFFPQSLPHVPLLNRLVFSERLRRELMQPSGGRSIIHGHGLWLRPNLDVAAAARQRQVPLVVSPRGMLAPQAMRFSRLQKAVVWRMGQRAALESAACLHATSASEYDDIRAMGLRAPVAVIRNGIDLPMHASSRDDGGDRTTVLSLGRIHRKKGLATLVEAWAEVERQRADWRLRIVGPDEDDHAAELRQRAAQLALERVTVEGPLYGERKDEAFRDAGLFVLPSTNENFGLTVAEALAAGVPVIASRGTPWAGLAVERAGWWVEGSAAVLAATLLDAMGHPSSELAAMGRRGRAWMERDFGWERVAAEMIEVYRWLLSGGEPPPMVTLG